MESVHYSTIGNEVNYERKQDEVIFGLEARYSYRFTDLFTLGAGAGVKAQWHLGTRYLSASAGGSGSHHMKLLQQKRKPSSKTGKVSYLDRKAVSGYGLGGLTPPR